MISNNEKQRLKDLFMSYYNTNKALKYFVDAHSPDYEFDDDEEGYCWDDIDINDCCTPCGCTKGVIVPYDEGWVFKLPFFNETYISNNSIYVDYCKQEAINYAKAVECGVDECFAETYYLMSINGYPIYIQEKFDVDDSNNDSAALTAAQDEWRDEGLDDEEYDGNDESFFDWDSDEQLRPLTYKAWPSKVASKFWDFVECNDINDIHSGNYSYNEEDNVLKMVDFSGFGSFVYSNDPADIEADFVKYCVA